MTGDQLFAVPARPQNAGKRVTLYARANVRDSENSRRNQRINGSDILGERYNVPFMPAVFEASGQQDIMVKRYGKIDLIII